MKKYKVDFSVHVNRNIIDIWSYIAEDSIEYADKETNKIKKFCFDFLSFALEMGVKRGSIKKEMRSFPIGSYYVFYRFDGETVRVMSIVHQSRNCKDIF